MPPYPPAVRGCIESLDCPAPQHSQVCPWHPANLTTLPLNDHDFTQLLTELQAPPALIPDLLTHLRDSQTFTYRERQDAQALALLSRRSPISATARALALVLKYPIARWQATLQESYRLSQDPHLRHDA